MSRKPLLALFISIAVHVAAVLAFGLHEPEPKVLSTGSTNAPVSLSFTSVSRPEPEPVIEKRKPKPESKPKSEPAKKPLPKLVKKAKPVLKKPISVVEKTEPKPEPKPEIVAETIPEPAKPELKPAEKINHLPESKPASQLSVIEETHVEGLSKKPVMVSKPSILNWKQPRYPKIARRRNQEGVVMLDVIIDENGYPETIDILQSSGVIALDKAAVRSVESWAFEPQQRNNQFVRSQVHIPVAFKLN